MTRSAGRARARCCTHTNLYTQRASFMAGRVPRQEAAPPMRGGAASATAWSETDGPERWRGKCRSVCSPFCSRPHGLQPLARRL